MVGEQLRRFWTDRCDIIVREGALDASTGRTVFTEKALVQNAPCRLSFRLAFETTGRLRDEGMAMAARQAVKLFLCHTIEVPTGSKIVVRRGDREFTYARSGTPAVFDWHQELRVELFRAWA